MSALAAIKQAKIDPGLLLRRLEREQKRRLDANRLAHYRPYAKQIGRAHV